MYGVLWAAHRFPGSQDGQKGRNENKQLDWLGYLGSWEAKGLRRESDTKKSWLGQPQPIPIRAFVSLN